MPNTKISGLVAGNPAQGTDEIPIARGAANFKVTAASIAALSPAGTVTAVGGAGTVNGITLTGTVTSTGNLTLGGTLSGVSLTTQVSGTLPLANGGTGQTTKAAAFNALSPVTSTGDLILGNGSNSSTRLPIGANNHVLTSNGTTASWQAGGGGGVTSFSAGSTGFNPSSSTTGAVTLSGTLNTGNGGTGTSSTPSNGQLLIGNGGGYSVANLTAGTGITITNSFGGITIAASGSGGPTIREITVNTSSGNFYNNIPSATNSAPLVGYDLGNNGAFYFTNGTSGHLVTSTPTISAISIYDSTSTFTSYTAGTDFSVGSVNFSVYDSTVTCYGLSISNTGMQTFFSDSKAAITSPSLAPLDAFSPAASANPSIQVNTTGFSYDSGSGNRGITVNKSGSSYIIAFGSADTSSATPTITQITFSINGSTSSYFPVTDFTVAGAFNSSNGEFITQISAINATLTTLLDNSFL